MGLYASLNLADYGFWGTTRNGQFPVDYSQGNQIFLNTFRREISANCPIRTGNLFGSIHASVGGMSGQCYTQCEYAEFVEYGTWKQSASPYFENALATAVAEAYDAWVSAYEEALELEYWYVFWEVFDHIMSIYPARNSITFAENWAHNSARVSVESQRTYDTSPSPPETIII